MAHRDLDKLFSTARSDCPSDALLDRYHWRVLDDELQQSVSAHLHDCPMCRQRLEFREKGFHAFDAARPEAMLDVIRSGLNKGVFSTLISGIFKTPLRIATTAVGALVLLVSLVFVLYSYNNVPGASSSGMRSMGGLELRVFVERSGRVSEALSGDEFHPGDRLRFKVSLPHEGFVLVVGQEDSGRLYRVFPIDSGKGERMQSSISLLPGAVRLDSSLGKEKLLLVLCSQPVDIHMLSSSGHSGIEVPSGCISSIFELNKTKVP